MTRPPASWSRSPAPDLHPDWRPDHVVFPGRGLGVHAVAGARGAASRAPPLRRVEQVEPHAAEADERSEFPWKSLRGVPRLGLRAPPVPGGARRRRRRRRRLRHARRGGRAGLRVVGAHCDDLAARVRRRSSLHGSAELKRPRRPEGRSRGVAGDLLPLGAPRRQRRRVDEDAGGPRRRPLRAERAQGLDHQRRGLRLLHRVRQDRPRRRAAAASSAFVVEPTRPASRSASSSRRWECAGRRPARSCSTTSIVPAENSHRRGGAGVRVRDARRSTGRDPSSAPRQWASHRARSRSRPRYATEREQFGRGISDFQGVQFMLADMATRVEAARLLVYRGVLDGSTPGAPASPSASAMAKLFASDTAMAVTTDAVQLLGGAGYTSDFPVERMMRDAKVTQIYEGTNQIQRIVDRPAPARGLDRDRRTSSVGDRRGPVLARAHRLAARRLGPHGAVQLAVRPPPRRHVPPAHRGHRRRAVPRRVGGRHPRSRSAGSASTGTASRSARARASTEYLAAADELARRRPRVRVLLHGRRARGAGRRRARPRAASPATTASAATSRPRSAARSRPRAGPARSASARPTRGSATSSTASVATCGSSGRRSPTS